MDNLSQMILVQQKLIETLIKFINEELMAVIISYCPNNIVTQLSLKIKAIAFPPKRCKSAQKPPHQKHKQNFQEFKIMNPRSQQFEYNFRQPIEMTDRLGNKIKKRNISIQQQSN